MGEDQVLSGRLDDGTTRRGGNWRNTFLNRHRKSGDTAGDEGEELLDSNRRARSLSRPRPQREAGVETFNQQAVLDQDRALIELLTQGPQKRERSAVRKPPPPPKVTPYKAGSRIASTKVDSAGDVETSFTSSQPPSPQGALGDALQVSPQRVLESATPQRQLDIMASIPHPSDTPVPTETGVLAAALASCRESQEPFLLQGCESAVALERNMDECIAPPIASVLPIDDSCRDRCQQSEDISNSVAPALKPIVPKSGELFTASDIDALMDSFGKSLQSNGGNDLPATFGKNTSDVLSAQLADRGKCTQNFQDVAGDFFRNHGMDVRQESNDANDQAFGNRRSEDFKIPERKALREQINAIDSWLEDDLLAREELQKGNLGGNYGLLAPLAAVGVEAVSKNLPSSERNAGVEGSIFKRLEDAKHLKRLGEKTSPVTLKNIAQEAIPLFPGMPLEILVRALRLFTSARYEDHDLYLRILGEIPVQLRGISPEMLVECVRILWRLRLHEDTYLELFSMEAMNMIRAKRRPTPRAPRRPPVLRGTDAITSTIGNSGPVPTPPLMEGPAPFNAEQLIHLGNCLSRLGAKHPTRFMEIYQEQLAAAIPRLTAEECELVCPTLAMSQLMHDPLRRAFLERCAQVEAGKPLASDDMVASAAPDIAQYQLHADRRRRRAKNLRNIYIIEASVRKETFSFFSSLPQEIRIYLDHLHANAVHLEHEGATTFSSQVAVVLDQLGVSCETNRMSGPLGLHVVAKATNPRADCQEIIYECSDTSAFYRLRPDKGAVPELTAWSKIRHRLLQRLGVQLTHISIWEWQQMSEAQRVNYMVKVQSLQ
mmetsp:Transcript_85717/g.135367  ORF Transcript_85717/g.135367 Transcript_85717/m.135367 type:complete len:830 (+) Transcript_85717:68-2557(+)